MDDALSRYIYCNIYSIYNNQPFFGFAVVIFLNTGRFMAAYAGC